MSECLESRDLDDSAAIVVGVVGTEFGGMTMAVKTEEERQSALAPDFLPAAEIEVGAIPSESLPGGGGRGGLNRFQGFPVTLKVQVGHTETTLKEWLEVGIGSRISLQESWRRPVHLFINNRLIGSGTIVLVGNRFGVRVTEWGHPQD